MSKRIIGLGMATLVLLGAGITMTERVSEGTVAVVYSTNGAKEEPLNAGLRWISPFDKTVEYPIRNQTLVDSGVSAVAADGKALTLDISYQYKTDPKKVVNLYKSYGRQDMQTVEITDKFDKDGDVSESHEAIKSISLSQDAKKIISEVIAKYTFSEIYQTRKAEVNAEVLAVLAEKESDKGFIVENVSMTVVNLDQSTVDAMNAKVAETTRQEMERQQLETEKIKAEKEKVIAEGAAQKAGIEAEAKAQRTLVAAEAKAKANELVQQTLTPELIQQQWISAWNGQLPQVQGEGMPIIQMPAAQ